MIVDSELVISPVTFPLNVVAVTTPVATIPPSELIPTPFSNAFISLLPPTWKTCLGSSVETPTLPAAYMLIYPNPASLSIH